MEEYSMAVAIDIFKQNDGKFVVFAGNSLTSAFMAGILRISKKMYNKKAIEYGAKRDIMLNQDLVAFPEQTQAQKFLNEFINPRYEIAQKI